MDEGDDFFIFYLAVLLRVQYCCGAASANDAAYCCCRVCGVRVVIYYAGIRMEEATSRK